MVTETRHAKKNQGLWQRKEKEMTIHHLWNKSHGDWNKVWKKQELWQRSEEKETTTHRLRNNKGKCDKRSRPSYDTATIRMNKECNSLVYCANLKEQSRSDFLITAHQWFMFEFTLSKYQIISSSSPLKSRCYLSSEGKALTAKGFAVVATL